MCVAICTLPGKAVTEDVLKQCAASNPDGGGFAYVDKERGHVVTRKGFFTVGSFIEQYNKVLAEGHGRDNPMLLHFRIATLGKVVLDNCHPFGFKGGAAVHNGSLWGGVNGISSEAEKSDTREFILRVGPNLNYDKMLAHKTELEQVVSYNKIAFLFNGGKYLILNEKSGSWHDGVWFSNNHWKRHGSALQSDNYYSRYYENWE